MMVSPTLECDVNTYQYYGLESIVAMKNVTFASCLEEATAALLCSLKVKSSVSNSMLFSVSHWKTGLKFCYNLSLSWADKIFIFILVSSTNENEVRNQSKSVKRAKINYKGIDNWM